MDKANQGMGIQGRLFLLLLIVLVPVLLIAGYVTFERVQESKAEAFQSNLELARAVARTFDAFVADVLHTEIVIGRAATASPPPSDETLVKILQEAEAANPIVKSFNWISPEGIHLATTNPELKKKKFGKSGVIRRIREEGLDWNVSPTFISPVTGEKIFLVSKAIRDTDRNLLGVVSCTVIADRLDALLSISRSRDAGFSLFDSAGVHVYRHPASDYIPQQSNWMELYPEIAPAFKGKEVTATVLSKFTGKKRLAAHVPCPFSGWVAAASQAEGDVVAAIMPTLIRQIAMILIVALGALLTAFTFSRTISRPIRKMQEHLIASRGLGPGKPFEPDGPPEVKELASAFNSTLSALRESEEQQRLALEAADLGTWHQDLARGTFRLDERAQRCFGFEKSMVRPSEITALFHPDDRDHALREIRSVFDPKSGRERLNIEHRILKPDGTVTWLSVHARVFFAGIGEERRSLFSLGTVQDISGIVLLRQELEESERKYRTLFENMNEAIAFNEMLYNEQGNPFDWRTLDVNPAYLKRVGKSRDEVVGRRFTDIHGIDRAPEISLKHFSRVVKTGRPIRFENYFHPTRSHVLISAFHMGGHFFAALVTDVTERKKAEEALRKSEHLLRFAVENSPDTIFIQDRDLRYVWGGRSAHPLSREEYIGHTDWDMATPEDAAKLTEIKRRVLEGGRGLSIELPLTLKGELRIFDATYEPWRDAEGSIIGLAGYVREITDRKRIEEELRESHEELELRVRERTAELERKNRELQEFAFVASHDMNEPLRKIQTIGSFLAMKGADRLDEDIRDYISRMTGAAGRLQELLAALLSYSRIEAKGMELRPTPLADVVRDVVSDMEVVIRSANAKVRVGPLWTVRGDPHQLRQLFQNLIGNAVKYRRPETETTINVYGERNNGTGRIYVKDNGIGFDEKYLDKIFQPFQRLHGKNEYSGLGIGLSICKKIVERHGGTITAKSTPGEGSTFIVTLPLSNTAGI